MELALYCPLCGYYEKKEDTTGKRGDFYTSVSVGPLFGELLAFQFAEWFVEFAGQSAPPTGGSSPPPPPAGTAWRIVEAGAHDGRLAADILHWLQRQRSQLFEQVEYCLVEPSPTRQAWQRETLSPFAPHVRWLDQLPRPQLQDSGRKTQDTGRPAIFFSNELLDAFPVHRLGWDAKDKCWFEWGVMTEQQQFLWVRLPVKHHASGITGKLPPAILDVLPDGFTTEVCPAAENWWREAATWLPRGKLLTLDYGLEAAEFFTPQRANGTLRSYHHHKLSDDLLARPGEQDLTAHVNFTAIKHAGESAGLKAEACVTQAQFLTGVAAKAWKPESGFGDWTAERTRQFQTLTHPDYLGRAFKVLVQSRAPCRP